MRKAFPFWLLIALLAVLGCNKFKAANPLSPSSTGGSRGHNFQEVWLTPNVGSLDLAEMFTRPDLWPTALKNTTIFSFYVQHLGSNGCSICGPNTLQRLKEVDAFRFLAKNGIKIAMEAGSLKPFNCNNIQSAVSDSLMAISNVRSSGGELAYIAMDEPFWAGLPRQHDFTDTNKCGFTVEKTADVIKEYILGVNRVSPGTKIGLIEPYVYFSAEQIKSFVLALEKTGIKLPFLHIDFDPAYAGTDFRGELAGLRDFCQSRGIAFGIILIGGDGTTNNSAAGGGLLMARRVDEMLGLSNQEHLLVQSWLDYPPSYGKQDLRLYPENLPESNPTTMTGILNTILDMAR